MKNDTDIIPSTYKENMDRPNIIFFFTDQQRWDTCGCYGQSLEVTPNLDQMAKEGVQFEYAFTCQPVCGPARSCLQAGTYATETGCFRNGVALRLDERTIAHILSENGYEVGYIGKWHLATTNLLYDPDREPADFHDKPVPPERRGGYNDFWLASDTLEWTSHSYDGHMFDADCNTVEFPPGRYRADAVTDFVLDYLRTRTREKPFFLFVSYIEPHHQNDHGHYEGPHGSKEKYANFVVPGDLEGLDGDWQVEFPDYLGCINALDANLGRIRQELDKLGLAENTTVIYTSDHGSHFRTRNSEYKRACHEGCVRVPLIIYGQDFKGKSVSDALVSLIDLPPTILSLAGVEPPAYMQGRPLEAVLEGKPADWPDEIFMQISESQVGRAIRTKKWKYSVSAPGLNGATTPASLVYIEDFLYDLEADPHERRNLIDENDLAGLRAELAERLVEKMKEAHEPVPLIIPRSRMFDPPKLSVSGVIMIESGALVMEVDFVGFRGSEPLQIPLAEILEDVIDIPIVFESNGTKVYGKLVSSNDKLSLVTPSGQRNDLESLLGLNGANITRQSVHCITIRPDPEDLERQDNSPEIHLVIQGLGSKE